MSLFSAAQVPGRRVCVIVQVFMPKCSRVFGTAPCNAVSLEKCYNTRTTCKFVTAYDGSQFAVYNFSTTRVHGFQSAGESPVYPIITAVDTAPTVLTPGEGIGARASCRIAFTDFPDSGLFTDPYVSSRSGDPLLQGSFWGKFAARQKFTEGKKVLIHTGFLDENGAYNAANFITRTYFITDLQIKIGHGCTIVAKDPLKLADGRSSQFPTQSLLKLTTDITAVQTSFVVSSSASGVGLDLVTQNNILIDQEVMSVGTIVSAGTNLWTLTVTRGPSASAIPVWYIPATNLGAAHKINSTVQQCFQYGGIRSSLVLYDLLISAGVPAIYIEAESVWNARFLASGAGNHILSTLLVKPTPIKQLLDEICKLGYLLWWDERAQLVKADAIVYRAALTPTFTDDNILQGSQSITEEQESRASQCWLSYNVINPTYDLTKPDSFQNVQINADLTLETQEKYGRPAIYDSYTRWLEASFAVANQVNARNLQQRAYVKRKITWEADIKDSEYWTGQNVGISSHLTQGVNGVPVSATFLITQADEIISAEGLKIRYVAQEQVEYGGGVGLWTFPVGSVIPATYPGAGQTMAATHALASSEQQAGYIWWGLTGGQYADGSPSKVWV